MIERIINGMLTSSDGWETTGAVTFGPNGAEIPAEGSISQQVDLSYVSTLGISPGGSPSGSGIPWLDIFIDTVKLGRALGFAGSGVVFNVNSPGIHTLAITAVGIPVRVRSVSALADPPPDPEPEEVAPAVVLLDSLPAEGTFSSIKYRTADGAEIRVTRRVRT